MQVIAWKDTRIRNDLL